MNFSIAVLLFLVATLNAEEQTNKRDEMKTPDLQRRAGEGDLESGKAALRLFIKNWISKFSKCNDKGMDNPCKNKGKALYTCGTSCKLTGCECPTLTRGDKCDYTCTVQKDIGKDLFNGNIDLYNYIDDNVDDCIYNCTQNAECKSVLYNGNAKRCIFKTENIFNQTETGVTNSAETNVLYSIKCSNDD